MSDEILFTCKNHIGLVTLNRPEALNAINLSMASQLYEQLKRWQDDSHIHAVIIQANGRAFCAGGDIRAIYHLRHAPMAEKMAFFQHEYALNYLIHHLGKPYIALMDGITMGGGVGISLHGSHPVASERFIFAMPETTIGFHPDIGSSYFLSRCPNFIGTYLGLTGNRLQAQESKHLGFVKHVIRSDHFSTILSSLIEADLSTDAFTRVDALLQPFEESLVTNPIHDLIQQVELYFKDDHLASIMAALDHGQEPWQQEISQLLKQKSPLSLHITLAKLQKAQNMTFDECLRMDHVLTQHCLDAPDFYEGVRALLVDKDFKPRWNPAKIEDVSSALVAGYFKHDVLSFTS